MPPLRVCLAPLAGLVAALPSVRAQATVYEPFSLGVGVGIGSLSAPGTGIASWSSSTPQDGQGAAGLTYAGLATGGNGLAFEGGLDGADLAVLAQNLAPSTTARVYLSALARVSDAAGGTATGLQFAGTFTGLNSSGRMGAGADAGLSGGDAMDQAALAGRTYLFVDAFQVTNLGGGNFSVTVSTSLGLEGSGALTSVGSFTTTTSAGSLGEFTVESSGYGVEWDELRIGPSLADVTPGLVAVPEPAMETLGAGLGAAVLAWGGRRRPKQV